MNCVCGFSLSKWLPFSHEKPCCGFRWIETVYGSLCIKPDVHSLARNTESRVCLWLCVSLQRLNFFQYASVCLLLSARSLSPRTRRARWIRDQTGSAVVTYAYAHTNTAAIAVSQLAYFFLLNLFNSCLLDVMAVLRIYGFALLLSLCGKTVQWFGGFFGSQ